MDERQFEQEYQNWKRQSAPDLWNRIEGKLKDYPEREQVQSQTKEHMQAQVQIQAQAQTKAQVQEQAQAQTRAQVQEQAQAQTRAQAQTKVQVQIQAQEELPQPLASDTANQKVNRKQGRKINRRMLYGAAAGMAAAICLSVSVPGLYRIFVIKNTGGGSAYENLSNAGIAEGTQMEVQAEMKVQAETEIQAKTQARPESQIINKADSAIEHKAEYEAEHKTEEGLLAENIPLSGIIPAGNTLSVPENALAVPADSAYFSQAVLADTELLFAGTVEDVFLEYDSQGRAVKVVYELSLNQLYYAQDYFTEIGQITVKSPIVKAEGDEVYLLYQMKKAKTYLLPLKKQEGNWELIYPFAPQVEITGAQSYLFHSGYSSLMNENTQVVKGEQEGENDYFYDRMLLREDDRFLADFLRLVEEQVSGS